MYRDVASGCDIHLALGAREGAPKKRPPEKDVEIWRMKA